MKLSELKEGEKAVVVKVISHPKLTHRLSAMGVVKGEKLLLEKIAPLGDPIEIKIKGSKISIRKYEANQIEVEVVK